MTVSRPTIFLLIFFSSFSGSIWANVERDVSEGFNQYVIGLIYKNIIGKNYNMYLSGGKEPGFVLYSGNLEYKKVNCDLAVQYGLTVGGANLAGITIGDCSYSDDFSATNLANQNTFVKMAASKLGKGMVDNEVSKKFKELFFFKKSKVIDEGDFYYFNVSAVGHGIFFSPTAIMVSEKRDRVLIAQYSTRQPCWEYDWKSTVKDFSLCEDAESVLKKVLRKIAAANEDVYLTRVRAQELHKLRNSKRFDECVVEYSKLLSVDPEYTGAYYGRAGCYQKTGKYKLALSDLESATKLSPDNAYVYREIAWIHATAADPDYRDRGRSRKNIDKYMELLQLRRNKPNWKYFEVEAAIRALNGDFHSAVEYENQALSSWRTYAKKTLARGDRFLEARGISKDSLNEVEAAIVSKVEIYKHHELLGSE